MGIGAPSIVGSFYRDTKVAAALGTLASATTIQTTAAAYGTEIDCKGYKKVLFTLLSGAITDATSITFTAVENAASSGSVNTACPQIGTCVFAAADDGLVKSYEVIPNARYVKIKYVAVGATTGGPFVGIAHLCDPDEVANPS